MEVFEATQALGGIVGTKAALHSLGAPAGGRGHPGFRPSTERAQALVDVLQRLGLDRSEGL